MSVVSRRGQPSTSSIGLSICLQYQARHAGGAALEN